MTLTLPLILWILVAHFIGDFLLQSDEMATRKSKDWLYLLLHVEVYMLLLLPFISWGATWALPWVLLNAVAHFGTDAVTSRITTRLYHAGERHWFFVVIGLDQLIHVATLLTTAAWLLSLEGR